MPINFKDYFCKLGCCYWHEFDLAYGRLDVKDKAITIVGNDCGSSALYFILRGAKRIVGFEKEQKLSQLFKEKVCKEFNICDKVEIHGEWTGKESVEQSSPQYPDTDILVMDCEGCESKFDVSQLQKYKQFCIAIHDWTENRFELMRKLYGSVLTFISEDNREFVFCKL
jgi:hypothetical protein